MVLVYYLLQQIQHNGAREPIYRHDSAIGTNPSEPTGECGWVYRDSLLETAQEAVVKIAFIIARKEIM